MKVTLLIPVLNESTTIEELLRRVTSAEVLGLEKEIIVIESGSTDGTKEKIAKYSGIQVIWQARPRGKGNAIKAGLERATGDIILIQDGDLEYDVADYPSLLQPLINGTARFVLGSRHLQSGSWKIRRFEQGSLKAPLLNWGGRFFHALFNWVYGTRLTDPTTMYKVFLRKEIEGIKWVSDRFDFDFELVAKLVRRGVVPLEVPVSYTSRGFHEGKKIQFFRDPITWMVAIFRFRLCRI